MEKLVSRLGRPQDSGFRRKYGACDRNFLSGLRHESKKIDIIFLEKLVSRLGRPQDSGFRRK
ncbi:hypothetical protein, partial [Streptococcus sp. A18]|uniref:hypothetical protein n=1 Tax=Streptococcus sp. A18 TaxID=3373125 RepID=UPI00374D164C